MPQYARVTPTFLTEALCLVTIVLMTFNIESDGLYSAALVLLG